MTMANSEAGAAQAENEVLARRCDAVADAAQSAIGWLADAGDLRCVRAGGGVVCLLS